MRSHTEIAAALAGVRARIEAAAHRAQRNPADIQLVAVSKMQSPEQVGQALLAGQQLFGENYAQELRDKDRALAAYEPPPEWHFIGALQRNKVKYVVGAATLIHAVDSVALAQAIDVRAAALELVQPILVEVNVAGEAQKHGAAPEQLPLLLRELERLAHVRCHGLMTMPPLREDPLASRPHFRALAQLAAAHGLPELSMGMSADLEVAIEEGATLVRVGTALFGERPRPP